MPIQARRIVGALAGLVGVGLIGVVAARRSPDLTMLDYSQLRVGMTRAEVEGILRGRPRTLQIRHRATIWEPQVDGTRLSRFISAGDPGINFFPGGPPGDQAVWITPTGLIATSFDPNGRLRERYFSAVHVSDGPSLLGWLASRPAQFRRTFGF